MGRVVILGVFVADTAYRADRQPKMGETINAIKEAGLRDQVKIMIGGAPVTGEFAKDQADQEKILAAAIVGGE